MKRPLATLGTVFLCSLAAVFVFFGAKALYFVAGAALAGGAGLLLCKKAKARKAAVCLLCAAAGLCFGFTAAARSRAVLRSYAGSERELCVLVTAVTHIDGDIRAQGRVQTADGQPVHNLNVRFYSYENMRPGDSVTAAFRLGEQTLDPGGAQVLLYAKPAGALRVERETSRVYALAYALKTEICVALRSVLGGEEGALCAALLTGDRAQLSAEALLCFQRAGVSHILVISGLHVSAILGLLYALLKRLRAAALPLLACEGALALFLIFFYGFTPSVLRACVMTLLFICAQLSNSRADGFTSLTAAALVIVLADPGAVTEASFLLSYACCFAIVEVFPHVCDALCARLPRLGVRRSHNLKARLRAPVAALLLPCVISLVTMPVLILFSMPVSLVSPLTNALIVPFIPPLLGASALTALAASVLPAGALCRVAGLAAGLAAKYVIAVARFFAGWSLACVPLGAAYLKWWLLLAGALWLVYLLARGALKKSAVCACCAAVLLCGILSKAVFTAGRPCAVLLDGRSVLVRDGTNAGLIVSDVTAREADYLHADLKCRFIDSLSYVIIIEKISDPAYARLRALFPDSIVVCLADGGQGSAFARDRFLRRRVGAVGLTPNNDGSVTLDCGDALLLCCTHAPEDAARYDAVVCFDSVEQALQGCRFVAYGETAGPAGDGFFYSYGDDVAIYFSPSNDFKAVLE